MAEEINKLPPDKRKWIKWVIGFLAILFEQLKDMPLESMGLTIGAINLWQGIEDRGKPLKHPGMSWKNWSSLASLLYMVMEARKTGNYVGVAIAIGGWLVGQIAQRTK